MHPPCLMAADWQVRGCTTVLLQCKGLQGSEGVSCCAVDVLKASDHIQSQLR